MKRSELLVPAGGTKQFIAAVENGADAIYIGGSAFSARGNAENFSDKEAQEAIDYGHLRGVKTYLAMNTLMEDEDLEAAYEQARRYYDMGVDAIIVQDLGFGNILKENLPNLTLHLSTQAGVYDVKGVEAAAKLGYKRVVLAREVTFEEMQKAVETGIEIEAFVHGALCMCYSGQCQMSRYIGGRSGNKGTCAQPCRLPYDGMEGKPYPLSPKDMCLIEEIGKMTEAGVASLKIEGRMKSPEYVAVVTSIYRKYLDLWEKDGEYRVDEKDFQLLKQIFNRGGFTKGYFYGDPNEELMASDFSKNAGIFAGEVTRDSRGPLVDMSARIPVCKGDYVEIRSKELTGNLITYVEEKKNGITKIGDIKAPVRKGDAIYRLMSSKQMSDARKTFEELTFDSGKFSRKAPITMKAKVIAEESLLLSARGTGKNGGAILVEATSDIIPQISQKGQGCEEGLKVQLAKTGGTAFEVEQIQVVEPIKAYVPVSAINALRRETLEKLKLEIIESYKPKDGGKPWTNSIEDESNEEGALEIYFDNKENFLNSVDILSKCKAFAPTLRALVPLKDYEECRDFAISQQIALCPYLLGMAKGPMKNWLEENFEKIVKLLKDTDKGIYVGNLGQIEMFANAGIKVFGDFGLNITNMETKAVYMQLGIIDAIESLEHSGKTVGAFPLMITEHRLIDSVLTDRKGAEYEVNFNEETHKTTIKSKDGNLDWETIEKECQEKLIRIYL